MQTTTERSLTYGIVAGMIGYATVAAFFAALDLVGGHPVAYTPSLLGQILFYGLRPPYTPGVEIGPVLAFNGVHLAGFLVIGFLVSLAFEAAERLPRITIVLGFVSLVALTLGTVVLVVLTRPVREIVPGWAIPVANLIAVLVMLVAMWELHPVLRDELLEIETRDDAECPPAPVAEARHH